MAEPSERDLRFAGYWVERGDLRRWLANIIAGVRREALVPEISEEETEAVARAICVADGFDPDEDWSLESGLVEPAWRTYEPNARAALAAFLRVRAGAR